jgi:hypothetical protein
MRIFGPKRDEVSARWRGLHNEELDKLYSSPKVIRIMKSKRMKWAKIGRRGTHTGFSWQIQKNVTTRKAKKWVGK